MSPLTLIVLAAATVDTGPFSLKLTPHDDKLRIEVSAGSPVHFRIADAAMLELQHADVQAAKEREQQLRELLDNPEHQERWCHESLLDQEHVARYRPEALAHEDFSTRVIAKPGVPVDVALWTAGPKLSVLVIDGRTFELTEQVVLHSPADWPAFDEGTLRDGRVWQRERIGGIGCFGYEGLLTTPGEWAPASKPFQHTIAEGGVMTLLHNNVVVNGKRVAKLELSSPLADTFEWVDDKRFGDRYEVSFMAEGPTRPEMPMSRCGGGTERDLVTLMLRSDFSVESQKIENLESCYGPEDHEEF